MHPYPVLFPPDATSCNAVHQPLSPPDPGRRLPVPGRNKMRRNPVEPEKNIIY
jgi:hypothetical protein